MGKKYRTQLLLMLSLVGMVSIQGHCAMTPSERKADILKMFVEHPDYFPEERRLSILNRVVTLGMTPYEAHLAGGAFFYAVTADKSKWPEHSDPFDVMWAQSKHPDNSKIKMTFKNSSQFPKDDQTMFSVYFEKGRAIKIEKLKKQGVL